MSGGLRAARPTPGSDLLRGVNSRVLHSRSAWKGERQVLAALWDQGGRVDDYDEGREILKRSPYRPIVNHD